MIFITSAVPDPSLNHTPVGNLQRRVREGSELTRLHSWLYFLIALLCNGAKDNPATVLLVQCSSSTSVNYWRATVLCCAAILHTSLTKREVDGRWRSGSWSWCGKRQRCQRYSIYQPRGSKAWLHPIIKYWDVANEYCNSSSYSS